MTMLILFVLILFSFSAPPVASYRRSHFCEHLQHVNRRYMNHEYKICKQYLARQRLYGNRRPRFASNQQINSKGRGKNGAASNDGLLIKWERVTGLSNSQ